MAIKHSGSKMVEVLRLAERILLVLNLIPLIGNKFLGTYQTCIALRYEAELREKKFVESALKQFDGKAR